jgi:hypothetical protein
MADTNPTGIPDSVSGKIPIESEKPTGLGPPSSFENYMQGTASQPKGGGMPAQAQAGTQGAPGTTPMELTRPSIQTAGPSYDTLLAQARTAQDGLGTIGQQLNEPNLKLKRSQSQLLKHKLQDTNGHIRAAGNRAGVSPPGEYKLPNAGSPVGRFLGMIGQGQDDLMAVQNQIKILSEKPESLQPGDMMFMQIKMSQAQQEIEFSSTLLGKVIDAIKQILNTQL